MIHFNQIYYRKGGEEVLDLVDFEELNEDAERDWLIHQRLRQPKGSKILGHLGIHLPMDTSLVFEQAQEMLKVQSLQLRIHYCLLAI